MSSDLPYQTAGGAWTLQRDWDKRIEACTLVTNTPKNYHSCAIDAR